MGDLKIDVIRHRTARFLERAEHFDAMSQSDLQAFRKDLVGHLVTINVFQCERLDRSPSVKQLKKEPRRSKKVGFRNGPIEPLALEDERGREP